MADLHIGSSAYIKLKIDELGLIDDIIHKANKNNTDIIFISGDIFDKKPNKKDLDRLNTILSNFIGKIFIIFGNHDFESNCTNIDFPDNIYVFGTSISNIYLDDLNLRIWGYSYPDRFIKNDIYKEFFNDFELSSDELNILIAHGGDTLHIPSDYSFLSTKFDYVAFGHIHKYNTPCKNIVYPGSLIPQDITEIGKHGYIMGSLGKSLQYELIPTSTQYEIIDFDITGYTDIERLYIELKYSLDDDIRYIVNLIGVKSKNLHFDINHLSSINGIEKINDYSTIGYDYNELEKYNENNILGVFIKELKNSTHPLADMALEYGVKAFLEAKEDAN